MPDSNNCFWHLSAVANFTTRHGFCSILEENTAFCVYSVHMKYWCAANSNLAYFIELTTALECQKQFLMSSISNLGGRESLEIAVTNRFHFCVRLYCNRSQMTSWRVKNKKVRTRRSRVPWLFVLHTLWRHLWSITVHKHKKMKSICFIL